MAVDVGQETTITFVTSTWTANLINALGWSMSRDAVETTDSSVTGGKTFIPSDIYDPGEIEIEVNFEQDDTPPIDSPIEEIRVDWAGDGTASQWTCQGFMTNFDVNAAFEDRMTATATLKMSGDITFN